MQYYKIQRKVISGWADFQYKKIKMGHIAPKSIHQKRRQCLIFLNLLNYSSCLKRFSALCRLMNPRLEPSEPYKSLLINNLRAPPALKSLAPKHLQKKKYP